MSGNRNVSRLYELQLRDARFCGGFVIENCGGGHKVLSQSAFTNVVYNCEHRGVQL